MHPDLIDIGFLHLKTYGACMAVGFLLCWQLLERFSGRRDLSSLVVSLMVSGVVGSRLAYVVEHWQAEFAAHPERIIRVDQGGLMFYGGLILAAVIFVVWCVRRRESVLAMADLLAAVIPLGHACGRLGCFFYGCCYGRDSTAWCAVTFPKGSPSYFAHHGAMVSVLPTQLFEAAALLALFALLLALRVTGLSRHRGLVSGAYLVGYGLIRFGLEFLRGDERAQVFSFSIGQTISFALMAVGLVLVVRALRGRSAS